MIRSLQDRQEFWGEHYIKQCQGTTTFSKDLLRDTCRNKCVLEIGPGEGRQFDAVFSVAKEYSITDICSVVLAQNKYDVCKGKYLLKSYTLDTDETFDVIHAWYVLHHVLSAELDSFTELVARHLKPRGVWLFNYAWENRRKHSEDGKGTTRYSDSVIEQVLTHNGIEIVSKRCIDDRSMEVLSMRVE